MEKREQLYEGKAKKVFATDDADLVIVDYKDDATAGDGAKKGTIRGKGVVNNRLSNNLMKMLAEKGVPTHFVEELSDRETLVKKVEIVPLEVIIRNVAAGSFTKDVYKRQVLRGAGDTRFAAVTDVGCIWAMVPLGAAAAFWLGARPVLVLACLLYTSRKILRHGHAPV